MRPLDRLGLRERRRPPLAAGVLATAASVGATTLLITPLKQSAPVESLGVVYVLSVLLVATIWGGALGYAAAVLSALAFNWFHLPPSGRLAIADSDHWVVLAVLLVVALVAGALAQRARQRAEEAEQRWSEADLATDMARLLLRGGGRLDDALPAVSRSLAGALGLPFAAIELGTVDDDGRGVTFPLEEEGRVVGTLVLPAGTQADRVARMRRHVVPALAALLAAARERDALLGDVVETAALRHSDVLKTALLRAVSHDLRTPLTAILTAEEALRSPSLTPEEHDGLVDDVGAAARRLSGLIDKLLDLSRLEADQAASRPQACSLPEVIESAIDHLGLPGGTFRVAIDEDLPSVHADAGQLERAFGNLLENAARFSGGHPVSVRGRRVGDRILVRIVDRGPGLPPDGAAHIFEPFYRGGGEHSDARGSGLGLAIVKGFVDANRGRVWAESVPRQGTTFVVEFPAPGPA